MSKEASLTEIMRYMDYQEMKAFRADWNKLSEEGKTFYKQEVGKALHG